MTLSEDKTKLVCLICGQKLAQINKDNARKHTTRVYTDSFDSMTLDTKKKLKEKYLSDMKKEQDQIQQFLGPQNLIQTAPYKLAYTIAKKPFSSCDLFWNLPRQLIQAVWYFRRWQQADGLSLEGRMNSIRRYYRLMLHLG